MRRITLWIWPLLAGLSAGLVGALIIAYTLPERFAAPLTVPVFGRASRSSEERLDTARAAQSLVHLFYPTKGAAFAEKSEASGVGVALTSDGLIAAFPAPRRIAALVAATFEKQPFGLTAAKTPDGQVFEEGLSGVVFLRTDPTRAPGVALKPVELAPYAALTLGEELFSFAPDGALAWQRVTELGRARGQISSEDVRHLFKVDATPAPGTPIFNRRGALVGLVLKDGIMPAEVLDVIARQYLKDGQYRPAALGLQFLDLQALFPLTPNPSNSGLLVTKTSPALKSGLQEGDILTVFDGQQLDGTIPLPLLLTRYAPGTPVELKLLRQGQAETVKVVLTGPP